MPTRKPTTRQRKPKPSDFDEIYPAFFTWLKLPDGSFIPKVEELPEWLTVPEAAAFLNLGVTTVKWLCDEGHLPCQRATPRKRSKRLIRKAEVLQYKTKQVVPKGRLVV